MPQTLTSSSDSCGRGRVRQRLSCELAYAFGDEDRAHLGNVVDLGLSEDIPCVICSCCCTLSPHSGFESKVYVMCMFVPYCERHAGHNPTLGLLNRDLI